MDVILLGLDIDSLEVERRGPSDLVDLKDWDVVGEMVSQAPSSFDFFHVRQEMTEVGRAKYRLQYSTNNPLGWIMLGARDVSVALPCPSQSDCRDKNSWAARRRLFGLASNQPRENNSLNFFFLPPTNFQFLQIASTQRSVGHWH